jgi:hypothetical protein
MAKDNSVRAYLPPFYDKLLEAQSKYTGESKSSIAANAIKERLDKIPIQQREWILKNSVK